MKPCALQGLPKPGAKKPPLPVGKGGFSLKTQTMRPGSLLLGLSQFHQNLLDHRPQRLEDSGAVGRHGAGFKIRIFPVRVEVGTQLLQRHRCGQIAFIILNKQRNLIDIVAVLVQILLEIFQGDNIYLLAGTLAIGDEYNAIVALHDKLSAGAMKELTGHRIKMQTGFKTPDGRQTQGQEVKEERALLLGFQVDEFAARVRIGTRKDEFNIRRFSAETRTVIDDLEDDLSLSPIDERHKSLSRS